jgi:hypothetical protein
MKSLLLRRRVRYCYATPAVSCQSSYRRTVEGVVKRIVHNPTPHFGRNTLVVKSELFSQYVQPKEVTHIHDGKRWRKVKS